MTTIAPIAAKLADAGLLRQAAATSVDTLLATFGAIADDIEKAAPEALGTTRMGISASGGKLSLAANGIDIETILRGEAGQSLADALGGAGRLLDEAESFAAVSGDGSLSRLLGSARADVSALRAYAQFGVDDARRVAAGGRTISQWTTVPGEFATAIGGYGRGSASAVIINAMEKVRREVGATRMLSQAAHSRIPDLEGIDELARGARAAASSAAGDDTMRQVQPLATAVDSLVDIARASHSERLPAAFTLDGKRMSVDIVELDRQVSNAHRAVAQASSLLEEVRSLVGTEPQHLHVRKLVTSAEAAVAALQKDQRAWRTAADRIVDGGRSTGAVTAEGYTIGGRHVARGDYGVDKSLWALFGEFGGVRRGVRKDFEASIRNAVSLRSDDATAASKELVETVRAHVQGEAGSSMLATGTNVAVDDALAAVRSRFGSAEELRAALAASVR